MERRVLIPFEFVFTSHQTLEGVRVTLGEEVGDVGSCTPAVGGVGGLGVRGVPFFITMAERITDGGRRR